VYRPSDYRFGVTGAMLVLKQFKIIRPANSLIFVLDASGGVVPEWKRGELILSTSSCISVGCYPEQDGPTEVILGRSGDVDPGYDPTFGGELETPTHSIVVQTVDDDRVLEMKVPERQTHVRIWVNDRQWPDKVIIGCGRQ
jgi:hypothetical protein